MSAPSLTPIGTHPTPSSENPSLPSSEHLCHAKAFEEHIHRHAEAVLMIVNDTLNKVGTGCLIGGDLLITNHHVISSPEEAEQSKAKLWYLDQAASDNSTGSIKWQNLDFDPSAYFFTCENNINEGSLQSAAPDKLDFTIVALKHTSYLAQVQNACLPLFSGAVQRPSGSVCVIHHPSQVDAETQIKGARQRSMGAIKKIEGCTLHYDASAMGGSSGSPVIDRNGNFVALHHQGESCPCSFPHSHSFAVLTQQIAQHLSSKEEKAKLQAQIEQAKEALSKLKLVGASVTPSIIELPPKDPKFCGRDKELKDLQTLCSQNKRIAITGLGGVGKTALAVEYANQCHFHEIVYFIDGSDPTAIELGLLRLAKELDVIGQSASEQLDNLKIKLKAKPNCLLIFDGVDSEPSFEYLETHLPTQIRCIIITTRMPDDGANKLKCMSMPLKEFSIEDALDFIEKQIGESEGAKELADKLGCLPLALTHACAYINQRGFAISRFLKKFSKKQTALFDEPISKPTKEQTILTTWSMSLLFMSPETLDLFNFCSFLAPGDIPYSILKQWLKEHHPSKGIDTLIKELRDYSMLTTTRPEQYAIHSLVQQVVREKLPANEYLNILNAACEVISSMIEFESYHTTNSKKLAILEPHCRALLEKSKQSLTIAAIHHNLGKYHLHKTGNYVQARADLQKCRWIYESLSNPESLLVAGVLHDIAELEGKQSDYKQGMLICETALKIYAKQNALSTKAAGKAFQVKGHLYWRMAMYDEALKEYNHALNTMEDAHKSKNHPDLSAIIHQIANVLDIQGHYTKALYHYKQAIEMMESTYNTKMHIEVAKALRGKANVLRHQGKYEQAFINCDEALATMIAIYDTRTHPEVANTLHQIGTIFYHWGKNEKALEYYEGSLEIKKIIYHKIHLEIAVTKHQIANILCLCKKYSEALCYYKEALQIKKSVYGNENHPEVAATVYCIANVWFYQGNYVKALKEYKRAIAIKKAAYKTECHPEIATIQYNIAKVYEKQFQYANAYDSYQQALASEKAVYGENHPDVAKTQYAIANFFYQQKKPAEAKFYLEKAMATFEAFNLEHIFFAQSTRKLLALLSTDEQASLEGSVAKSH